MTRLALLALLISAAPRAQETAVFVPPAPRPMQALVTGERVAFLRDGGCTCQAESRVPAPPLACNGAACTASRLRSRLAVVAALDGGANDNP